MNMRYFLTTLFTAIILIGAGSQAQAALTGSLYDWDSTTADYDDQNRDEFRISGGQDILRAWHAVDDTYHYFRLDLRDTPTTGDYAALYGIYIDVAAGGADGGAFGQTYVPDQLQGIDYIVDSHFEPTWYPDDWFKHDTHEWNDADGTFTISGIPVNQQTGATLEWKVAIADLGGATSFTWYGVSHDIGGSETTYDVTTAVAATSPVPLPAAGWLFATGLAGLAGLRRKQNS